MSQSCRKQGPLEAAESCSQESIHSATWNGGTDMSSPSTGLRPARAAPAGPRGTEVVGAIQSALPVAFCAAVTITSETTPDWVRYRAWLAETLVIFDPARLAMCCNIAWSND
jgi:hypothetical protein